MTLKLTGTDPFDVLFKNFFNNDSFFSPAVETKISHPVDIYETKDGLHFEIACTGLTKEDVNINIEGDVLRVTYEKNGESEIDVTNFIHKGIYTQTWIGYGGLEFAKKPELATVEEQIIVANRISTQGYQTKNEFITLQDRQNNKPFFRPPVGFGGWGCKKNVGKPGLFKSFPSKTLLREYKLGDRNKYVYGI